MVVSLSVMVKLMFTRSAQTTSQKSSIFDGITLSMSSAVLTHAHGSNDLTDD